MLLLACLLHFLGILELEKVEFGWRECFHGLGCDVCLSGTDMHKFSQRACWGAFLTLSPSPVSALRLVGLLGKELGFSLLNRFEFEHIPTSLSSFLRV